MKIEIDFEDVERLKRDIKFKNEEIEKLKAELKSLDKDKLYQDAYDMAEILASKYIHLILISIGFKDSQDYAHFTSNSIRFDRKFLVYNLGKNWYDMKEKLNIEVGATITNTFKKAFVKIGIKPEFLKNE